RLISEAEIRKMVEGETETVRERVSDIVDETIGYSIEKTERAMERVANEKIMAVNEYSDTVLEEINKNHKEVTFLYDMLNDKHETLMASIGEANQIVEEIRQTVRDAEITAGETAKKAKDAENAAEGALMRIHNAELSAREAQDAVQEAVQSVMGAVEDTRTDLWSIHSARTYSPEVVEEVRESGLVDEETFSGQEPETESAQELEWESVTEQEWEPVPKQVWEPAAKEEEAVEVQEEIDFQPIRPKRVEIIHEPEADYVAEEPELSTSAAFAQMGIFGNREPAGGQRLFDGRRDAASVPEEPRGVDIRFAKGNDNGRNSNERILELHKAGKSNMAIAKELGLGLGEVKLVIDLFEGM
ncbi:MAG: hypothetical protein K2O15_02720, partial [Lachnospiraceae bacterium]|nr:hypothetical protein [Lachnospiraceae bacterium]